MSHPTTPERVFDDNYECLGCGAHLSEPCHPTCPFETGQFGPAVILRIAASRLHDHPAGVGHDIGGALFATSLQLLGPDSAARATDEAQRVLTDFLINRWRPGAEPIRSQVVYRHGLFTGLNEIRQSLYDAAAHHDGYDTEPDGPGGNRS